MSDKALRDEAVERLRVAVTGFSGDLPDSDIAGALSLINHGEAKIGLENLLAQLYEYDVTVDLATFEALADLVRIFHVSTRHLEVLRPS